MARDPNKLRVFQLADALVLDIYNATKAFPPEERYGLQAQTRRASISSAANIVEGCARRSLGEYLSFLNIAAGSACELSYLLSVAYRLGYVGKESNDEIAPRCAHLSKSLVRLIESLEAKRGRRPAVDSPLHNAEAAPKPKA
jgi:four helix bundle protein